MTWLETQGATDPVPSSSCFDLTVPSDDMFKASDKRCLLRTPPEMTQLIIRASAATAGGHPQHAAIAVLYVITSGDDAACCVANSSQNVSGPFEKRC